MPEPPARKLPHLRLMIIEVLNSVCHPLLHKLLSGLPLSQIPKLISRELLTDDTFLLDMVGKVGREYSIVVDSFRYLEPFAS